MEHGIVEMGITDYLHDLELWRQRLVQWQARLPWPEGAAAALCADNLLDLSYDVFLAGRLLRMRTGQHEDLPESLLDGRSAEQLETELGLALWRMLREEARLLAVGLPVMADRPPPLPRARVRLQPAEPEGGAMGRERPGPTDRRPGAADRDERNRRSRRRWFSL